MVTKFIIITALVTVLTFGFVFGTAIAITKQGNCVGSASAICTKKHPPRPVVRAKGVRVVVVIALAVVIVVSAILAIPITFHYFRRFSRAIS